MSNIVKAFPSQLLRGGILLVNRCDAILIVDQHRQRGVRVLGIDGFLLSDESTQPDSANSIDLSNCTMGSSWDRANVFLKTRVDDKLYFEIVADEAD